MNIVILDGEALNPGDLSWAPLAALGELTVHEYPAPGDVVARIGDAPVIFTNKTVITREIMDACPQLKYIGVLATGFNVIDIAAAREKGVVVTNVPAYSTQAVAQFTMALLLEICHHVGKHNDAVQQGRWSACRDFAFWDYPLMELAGKTMGIIGFGRIGRAVGTIARAFSMRVLACNRSQCPEGLQIGEYVTLEQLLAQSDIISLHCPQTPDTVNLINKTTLAQMKDGAILLNTARGAIVNEEDVTAALRSGKLRGYGADVVSHEPILESNPLLQAPNCVITPHMAWAPAESRRRILHSAEKSIQGFLSGQLYQAVNM